MDHAQTAFSRASEGVAHLFSNAWKGSVKLDIHAAEDDNKKVPEGAIANQEPSNAAGPLPSDATVLSEIKKRHRALGDFFNKYQLDSNFGISWKEFLQMGKGERSFSPDIRQIVKIQMEKNPLPDLPILSPAEFKNMLDETGIPRDDFRMFLGIGTSQLFGLINGTKTITPYDTQTTHKVHDAVMSQLTREFFGTKPPQWDSLPDDDTVLNEIKKRYRTPDDFFIRYRLYENFRISKPKFAQMSKGEKSYPPAVRQIIKTEMEENPLPDLPILSPAEFKNMLDEMDISRDDTRAFLEIGETQLFALPNGTGAITPYDVQILHRAYYATTKDIPLEIRKMSQAERRDFMNSELPKRLREKKEATRILNVSYDHLQRMLNGRSAISTKTFYKFWRWTKETPVSDGPLPKGTDLPLIFSILDWDWTKEGVDFFESSSVTLKPWMNGKVALPAWAAQRADPLREVAIRRRLKELMVRYESFPKEVADLLRMNEPELQAGLDGALRLPGNLLDALPDLSFQMREAQRGRQWLSGKLDAENWDLERVARNLNVELSTLKDWMLANEAIPRDLIPERTRPSLPLASSKLQDEKDGSLKRRPSTSTGERGT